MHNINDRYLKAKRDLFDKVYGDRLNPEQCRAVFTTRGPLLVLAGAGSGKTTVLINRIVFLIKYGNAYFSDFVPEGITEEAVRALEGAINMDVSEINEILPQFIVDPVPHYNILAITFTNKAANEIKKRLLDALGDETISSEIWAGTFHNTCMRILRKYTERAGLRQGFSIYDTDDQKHIIRECMKELEIDEKALSPKTVINMISRSKEQLRGPDEMDTSEASAPLVAKVYSLYAQRMQEYNAVDFDDIIMKAVKLLQDNDDIRQYYQRKFRYVLVDEYQDTNYAQFVLNKLLSDGYRNLMVVGDDDQSIYKFRGATVENILGFDKTYPDATVIKLEQNYRSTNNILEAANSVISHNPMRHGKSLWSNNGEGELITLHKATSPDDEGRYILSKISHSVRTEGRKYSDFAVLYRARAVGRALEASFRKSGIPYRIIGDISFYSRKEVKDMMAYLSVVVCPEDSLRLKRVVNEPKRKIGAATIEAVEGIADLEHISMYSVMERASEYVALGKSAEKLTAFTKMINKVREEKRLPSEMLAELFEVSGYENMLLENGKDGELDRENVLELMNAASEYEARCYAVELEPTARGFLEEVALISEVDKYDESADAVVLMTMHAAKGLEFPVVFLPGMEEGLFPSQQNFAEPSELPEERRLAYVAITRAKQKLYMSYTDERMLYGRTTKNILSRFVAREIPPHLIDQDKPKSAPPRSGGWGYAPRVGAEARKPHGDRQEFDRTELDRPVNISGRPGHPQRKAGAAEYGIEKLPVGSRVTHDIFGKGMILSAHDMGGDVLYEVDFESVGIKKLMATFAKLRKI